jgi:predicted secreted protein
MKKTVVASLVVVVSLAVAVFCAGCTTSTTPSPSPGSTTTAVGNATTLGAGITVVQGQNFTIQLQSNSSTGYHWELTYDNSSVLFINRAYSASSIPAAGAQGADVFTFQGTKTGTSVIIFNNISPSNQTTNSVNYTITCTTSNVTQGNAVLVSQGQNFTIQLQSNPSTGYQWVPTYDNSTLTLVNQAFAGNDGNQCHHVQQRKPIEPNNKQRKLYGGHHVVRALALLFISRFPKGKRRRTEGA